VKATSRELREGGGEPVGVTATHGEKEKNKKAVKCGGVHCQ